MMMVMQHQVPAFPIVYCLFTYVRFRLNISSIAHRSRCSRCLAGLFTRGGIESYTRCKPFACDSPLCYLYCTCLISTSMLAQNSQCFSAHFFIVYRVCSTAQIWFANQHVRVSALHIPYSTLHIMYLKAPQYGSCNKHCRASSGDAPRSIVSSPWPSQVSNTSNLVIHVCT